MRVTFLLLSLVGACAAQPTVSNESANVAVETPEVARTETPPEYSPFVVAVRGGELPFDHISFKDVGMSLPDQDRSFVYEAIAESLRHELMSRDVPADVEFSAQAADPTYHRSCQGQRIYVDLWHGASSPNWGYSLWSGCGSEDEFAWHELTHPSEDAATAAEPIAREIARSLDNAIETGCFRKRC
ncbi:MAG: hypothetical protein AAGF12_41525 [Myxococcota bacterium]